MTAVHGVRRVSLAMSLQREPPVADHACAARSRNRRFRPVLAGYRSPTDHSLGSAPRSSATHRCPSALSSTHCARAARAPDPSRMLTSRLWKGIHQSCNLDVTYCSSRASVVPPQQAQYSGDMTTGVLMVPAAETERAALRQPVRARRLWRGFRRRPAGQAAATAWWPAPCAFCATWSTAARRAPTRTPATGPASSPRFPTRSSARSPGSRCPRRAATPPAWPSFPSIPPNGRGPAPRSPTSPPTRG